MPRYSHALQIQQQRAQKPEWLRVRYPTGQSFERIKGILATHNLHTVCEEAHCPNVGDCWTGGTATFILMGDMCTRGCRFCMVRTGNPHGQLDQAEPLKVAKAVTEMGLRHVVITSVNRDDLPDGGASHFAVTVKAVRQSCPEVVIEALIPDFQGKVDDVRKVVDAGPEVIAHNIETTEALTTKVRDPRATYKQSLRVLRSIKSFNPSIYSKSSIMLGFGESQEDIVKTMRDLREAQVDVLTLGQYLPPSKGHIPVCEYVSPDRFDYYKHVAEESGFLHVAAGPFVRSSYRAGELFAASLRKRQEKPAAAT